MQKPIWVGSTDRLCDPLPPSELRAVLEEAAAELTRGRAPLGPTETPHALFTIGPPGAGKTALAPVYLRSRGRDPAAYVTLDFDELVLRHPRARGLWAVPDFEGRPSGVHYGLGWLHCGEVLLGPGAALLRRLLRERYNLVVQSHDLLPMIDAQRAGYHATLLYVATSAERAQTRARRRAVETGRFLAPTLAAQDLDVARSWAEDRNRAPFYALWADSFVVVANHDDCLPSAADFRLLDPHAPGPWGNAVSDIAVAIDQAHATAPKK